MASRPTKRIPIGTDHEFPAEINNAYGDALTGYKVDNALSCVITRGDDQATLATPAIWWRSTGQGLVNVKISRTDTAGLEPGTYALMGFVVEYDGDRKCIFDGDLVLTRGPGQAVPPKVYNTYDDMVDLYPPVAGIYDADSDETGYAEQRARGRRWVHRLILRHWAGNQTTEDDPALRCRPSTREIILGEHGVEGSGPPDPTWLQAALDDDALVASDDVKDMATLMALSYVLARRNQTDASAVAAGRSSPDQQAGLRFAAEAEALARDFVAWLDVDHDDAAELRIDCRDRAFIR